MTRVSVIIVSWNVRDLLRACLASLSRSAGDFVLEIFVVDNNSADKSAQMVEQEFPQVKLIANKENFGFAAANNQAIRQASGDYLLLLNPDTEVSSQTIAQSIIFMQENERCGVMGPKLLNEDKSVQPSIRRFPTVWPILLMFLKIPKLIPSLAPINRYLATDFDYNKKQSVDQVMGAFMFIRRDVLDKVGLLDEDFFIWFEEVDFCRRVVDAGFQVMYAPNIETIHYGGRSFGQQKTIKKQKLFFNSAWRYFTKHGFKLW